MEKRCEFCKALRPVVFCKSDAAHLCLSCDAKVHSANALSYRHPRTLVCESCRFQPALVRCLDHQLFMCHSCDVTHHVSLDHHKKIVSCYVGCPSAKDLAELWGFHFKDPSIAFSHSASANSSHAQVSALYAESGGSSSRGMDKVVNDDNLQKSSYLILQQIMDLERLQLSESIDDSCLAHVKQRSGGSPLKHDASWMENRMVENHLEHSDSPLLHKSEEPLSSPFPQLDSLTNAGNPLNGEPFWQSVHNNEIWLQNMQDLGVCDEVQCFDDVNIPDVDLTFRNFEEVFGGEQEEPDDKNKHPSFTTVEETDDESQPSHPLSIRPSYSVSSFSESSGSDYKDDDLSPAFPKQRVSCATLRYKEKRVARHEKQGQYTSPRSMSDFKKRGKSRMLKVEGLEDDSGSF